MYTLRIPTREQYAYIEVQMEGSPDLTPIEVYDKYKELTQLVQEEPSLMEKDFNQVLDEYIWGSGTMTADQYAAMTPGQQQIIQTIKRSRKRNEAKS